jgi:hypothetical protein
VIGVRPSTASSATAAVLPSGLGGSELLWRRPALASAARELVLTAVLVVLPVFIQAPWVRQQPFSAALFSAVLLAAGVLLNLRGPERLQRSGQLLVGFSGSWLAGSLFWGWARLHPLCHLPVEALALPLALAGLSGRWRLAGAFYLGSLLGTAATDAAIACTGLMPLWPAALAAEPAQAALLLQQAGQQVLQPGSLLVVGGFALALGQLSRWLGRQGEAAQVAATALATTLVVDGVFLLLTLVAPRLSGLV